MPRAGFFWNATVPCTAGRVATAPAKVFPDWSRLAPGAKAGPHRIPCCLSCFPRGGAQRDAASGCALSWGFLPTEESGHRHHPDIPNPRFARVHTGPCRFWFGTALIGFSLPQQRAIPGPRDDGTSCQQERRAHRARRSVRPQTGACYFKALSVIALVQAPSGALEITGSDPPDSSVCTVRSASAGSSAPFDPAVSLATSVIMRT